MGEVSCLRSGSFDLHRITMENRAQLRAMLESEPDSQELVEELEAEYLPKYDEEKRLVRYGFYILRDQKLVGLSLLEVDSWNDARGSTGADILPGVRGQGIAPAAKVHLFYLGFALLDLNRIETGHFVSNRASQRSIEKTPGFKLEGLLREHGRNPQSRPPGEFEDVLYYGIIRRDWQELYKDISVQVVYE